MLMLETRGCVYGPNHVEMLVYLNMIDQHTLEHTHTHTYGRTHTPHTHTHTHTHKHTEWQTEYISHSTIKIIKYQLYILIQE